MSHDRGCWKCGADSMGEKRDCAARNPECVKKSILVRHGCNVTTCPSPQCQSLGQCKDAVPTLPVVPSPPLAPDLRYVAAPPAHRTIIAFTGLAGAGKSTAAMRLVHRHKFERVRFAGPLKAMMAAIGLNAIEIDGSSKEMPCDLLGGKTPRYAMQTIGNEWGRELIGPDLWVNAWRAAVEKLPAGVPVVVDDCRYPNEAATIQAMGGIIVRIERPGAGTASTHVSEQHVLPAAVTLHNTISEKNLLEQVDRLILDLSWADTAP